MDHLFELLEVLSDREIELLVENVGIKFTVDKNLLKREDYENVIDEADREDFYREYKKIITKRK